MGKTGRTILWVVIIAVVVLLILWVLGFFSANVEGEFEAPNVDVSAEGGSMPDLDVDSGEVSIGTERETVDVPEVDVDVGSEQMDVEVPEVNVEPAGEPDEE